MHRSVEPPEEEPPSVRVVQRSLVVLAGLPGAGKSTLLENMDGRDVVVLDSEQVWRGMRMSLPARIPYSWFRPVVHLIHRSRIAWHCVVQRHPVVAHEPATRASTRAMLVFFGALTGRRRIMVWLEAAPEEALAGQRERGRVLNPSSFRRHVRRSELLSEYLRVHPTLRGWHAVLVFRRRDLEHGLRIRVRRAGAGG